MSTGLAAFTFFHVALSLVGILAGFVVLFALLSNGWTSTFLVTTVATNVTGFLFPFHKFSLLTPSASSRSSFGRSRFRPCTAFTWRVRGAARMASAPSSLFISTFSF